PAHTRGEKGWFCFYGVASTIYRVIICVGIILMIAQRFFFVGMMLAVGAVVLWLFVPLGKLVHYLAASPELMRVRPRAVGSTLLFVALVVVGIGVIDAPEYVRVEGICEPTDLQIVSTTEPGFLTFVVPDGSYVEQGDVLLRCESPALDAELTRLEAIRDQQEIRRRMAFGEPAAQIIFLASRRVSEQNIGRMQDRINELTRRSTFAGTWLTDGIEDRVGAYLIPDPKGRVGMVASLDDLMIRVVAGQDIGPRLRGMEGQTVDIRVRGRPDARFSGVIEDIPEAGRRRLPSAALGYAVGGQVAISPDDPEGTKAAEPFFEVWIRPDTPEDLRLLTGQRVIVRIELPGKPLGAQWWRAFRQMIQRRFHIL
ncbi:MAG: HlyD family secretion protein, partial [Planctomycetota bacterium]